MPDTMAQTDDSQLNHNVNDVDDPRTEQQLCTPPGEPNDIKTSRKREREVSLEPATPQATTLEIDSDRPDGKERRTPAKKNRTSDIVLEATEEEAEEDAPLSGSPPHETKIRQISQGVEDITWQNMNKDDRGQKMAQDAPPKAENQDTPNTTSQTTGEAQDEPSQEPSLPGEKPPILDDTAGDEEDTGAAAGAEQPADSHVAGAPEAAASSVSPSSSSDAQLSETPRLPTTHRRDSDSDHEKGLKRKLGDRTVSETGEPQGRNGVATVCATKRPRDDPEADPNTREKKRPTPPPEEDSKMPEKKQAESPAPKLGGFMAYASTSSPFASVQGPRIFGGKQPSTSPWTSAGSPFSSSSTSPSPLAAAAKDASSSQAHKRTGLEAFASSTSPFASAAKRPKSPPPPSNSSRSPSRHGTPARSANAFSAYAAGGAQGFAAPTPKRFGLGMGVGMGVGAAGTTSTTVLGESSSGNVRAVGSSRGSAFESGKEDEDSEKEKEQEKDSGVSFGERLRAGRDKEDEEASDEEKRLNLTELEVMTGEEEEETVYQVRGKLFTLSSQNQWKERGTGMLRLNVRREDGGGARLIMRKEAVYTVLLNATLFKGMRCFLAQDPRYLRFSVFEAGATTHYNLRVSNAKIAQELLEEINAHIPSE